MNEKDAYLRIASRAIESAEYLANYKLQENSAFFSYHAFESIGGALCNHYNQIYPRSHIGKINQIITTAKRAGIQRSVTVVATILNSLGRNNLLYPNPQSSGGFTVPEMKLTVSNSKDLLRRVKGIKRVVESIT